MRLRTNSLNDLLPSRDRKGAVSLTHGTH
jgi:hypothetical protein